MNVTKEILEEAIGLVDGFESTIDLANASCGCFGCGLGCSGTVGMD